MTHAADLRECPSLCNPEHVAKALGLTRSREERKKWACPSHGGTSLSLRRGPDGTLQAKCFGCDFAGDVLTLIGAVHRLDVRSDFRELARIAADIAGVTWTDEGTSSSRRAPEPPAPSVLRPSYPPGAVELWNACERLETDRELAAYLRERGLDPRDVQSHGLARVLPRGALCPSWAACGRRWSESGHRIVLPVFDALGELRSVRAWRPGSEAPKRVAPRGFSTAGLVLADLDGLAMLRGEGPPRERITICEGEPDFLFASLAHPLTDRERGAFLGVTSGSWSAELAARIHAGSTVRIATDPDAAGDKYAVTIAATLAHCDVRRLRVAT